MGATQLNLPRRLRKKSAAVGLEGALTLCLVGIAAAAGMVNLGTRMKRDIAAQSSDRSAPRHFRAIEASGPARSVPVAAQAGLAKFVHEALEAFAYRSPHAAMYLDSPSSREVLAFERTSGPFHERVLRHGDIAAHTSAKSGETPRFVTAFPAGNSGGGLFFRRGAKVDLHIAEPLKEARGWRGMRGVTARVEARGARELVVDEALLGSVRVLRDYIDAETVFPGVAHERTLKRGAVTWKRASLDGSRHYSLVLRAEKGTELVADGDGAVRIRAASEGEPLRFRVETMNDEPALTPIPAQHLLRHPGAADRATLESLAFLAYEEKLLAGSWRYLTYFGRDTLMSVRLMMDELTPKAIEAGLGAVIERLDDAGRVAHEEDLGDFAVLRRAEEGQAPGSANAPIHDYKMVDDDFMLAPVLAAYLLDTPDGQARAAAFLGKRAASGETYGELVRRNLTFVTEQARPYGEAEDPKHLISLLPGQQTGQWRDSLEGLGGGRYPYDINAVLVPSALEASARLAQLPALGVAADARAEAVALASTWQGASRWFDVEIPAAEANRRLAIYAAETGVPPAKAEGAVRFPALALDGNARPIEVMHSDEGARLLFARPSDAELVSIAERAQLEYPRGRLTEAGSLVANPAFAADAGLRKLFSPGNYHGAVVWSWQEAQMLEGLKRQLARGDLAPETRRALERARDVLWDNVEGHRAWTDKELWGAAYDARSKRFVPDTYGKGSGDATEANLIQLWSTVYLGVKRPK